MNEQLFLLTAAVFFSVLIAAGWRWLPGERWQILATVPVAQELTGWRGLNLTGYGAMLATAVILGIGFVLALTAATSQALAPVLALLALLIGLCVPAARLVAGWVEGKRHTFTIGGAFFLGLLATPVAIWLVNAGCRLLGWPPLAMEAVLAALAIGYMLGEGLGRLACISFGCCYGKPLAQCGRLAARLLNPVAFVFNGPTKKAVYEGGLAGVKLLPVQGLTSILYTAAALGSSWLYLHGHFRAAFLVSLLVSQCWRVLSEMLRADFRGFAAITAYQKMGLAAVILGSALGLLLPAQAKVQPAIAAGLSLLGNPWLILAGQALWLALFLYFGRSTVTGATIVFTVHQDRI